MKKSILVAFTLLLSLNTMSYAQQKWSKDIKKELYSKRGGISPEESAKMQTKEMTLALDLSDEQQKDVEEALLSFHNDVQETKTSMDKKYDDMSLEEKRAIKSIYLDHQIALKQKMKTILNEKQYEKFSTRMVDKRRELKTSKKG